MELLTNNLPIIVVELFLVGGGALAFGWWQLRDLAKEREKTVQQEKLKAGQAQDDTSAN